MITKWSFANTQLRTKPKLAVTALVLWICGVGCIRLSPTDMPVGSLNGGKCRLVINEINIFPAGKDQFLELRKVCQKDFKPEKQFAVNLKFYKILFLTHDGFLLAACHLTGKVKPKSRGESIFFTLSENEDHAPDMKIKSCEFSPDEFGNVNLALPIGEHAPVAVVVIYSSDIDSIKDLSLLKDIHGGFVRTKVDLRMEKKIKENLHDILIYTTSSPYTSCEYFRRFYSLPSGEPMKVIRDWGQLDQVTERSLSHCPQQLDQMADEGVMPFQSQNFVYAPISPGEDNNCRESFRFEVEIDQPPRKKIRKDFERNYECYVTTEDPAIDTLSMISSPLDYSHKLETAIREFQAKKQQTPTPVPFIVNPTDGIGLDCQPPSTTLESGPGFPRSFTKKPISASDFENQLASQLPLVYTSCDDMQPKELVATLKNMKDPPLFWQDVVKEDTCSWFDWLPNHSFRCKYCNMLLTQGLIRDRPGSPLITKIMTVGQINRGTQAKSANRKILKKHLENPLHLISVDYVKLFDSGKRGDVLWKEFTRVDGPLRVFTNATENLFAMAFTIADLDTSFQKSTKLRALLHYYGVNTGHVYNNPMGTQRMISFMSETLHADLLSHLKKDMPEFSLLIDSSTDVASIPALAIVFQTFDEANNVKIYLYKVIWINGRETGEQLWEHFLREMRNDGLEDYLRQKCVGFASDGGSNVLAFRDRLKRFTDHGDRMVMIHCFAHKSERAMVHAWKDRPYILNTEDIANKLHRIFGCRSAKKKQHLQVTQDEQGDTRFSMKRIQKTRWVNSRLRALDPIIIHWRTIVKALQRVYDDSTIKDAKQRQIVKDAMDTLKDPTFLVTAGFVTDVYTSMSSMSLKLQDRGGSLIGKKEKREQLKSSLLNLKTQNGPFLQSILDNSKFSSPAYHGKEMSLEYFERGDVVHWGIAMNKQSETTEDSRLHDTRAAYIDLLISQLNAYFPIDPTDDFDIFDASNWPLSELRDFGNANLSLMNTQLKWNFDSAGIIDDWISLKLAVSNHPQFGVNKRNLNPEQFWALYLKEPSIRWSEGLKKIISNVITIPASTAEVERIFSYYTQIKTVRRFNLNVATVDSLIRIRFNGPTSLTDFDPFHYAWSFIEKHARADDASISIHRSSRKINAPVTEDSSASSELGAEGDLSIHRSVGSHLEAHSTVTPVNQQVEHTHTSLNPVPACMNILASTLLVPEDDQFCRSTADDPAINDIMAYIESLDAEGDTFL